MFSSWSILAGFQEEMVKRRRRTALLGDKASTARVALINAAGALTDGNSARGNCTSESTDGT
jgi:hypothetical protein